MNKELAIKKLKSFETLNKIKYIDLVDVLTENDFIKFDPIVSFFSIALGTMIFTVFFTGILSILFPDSELSGFQAFLFLSTPIVLSLTFFTLMIRKDNQKKENLSKKFLDKFQKMYYIENVNNILKYYDQASSLEIEIKKELMDDENFLKTCLHELKMNNPEFIEHQDTIMTLAKPMTEKRLKKEENKKSMKKMHMALFKEGDVSEEDAFKIVEENE